MTISRPHPHRDDELRRKWTFASEALCANTFGTPDEIVVRGGTERWVYWRCEGDHIASEYRLLINGGRLATASQRIWDPPRKKPKHR